MSEDGRMPVILRTLARQPVSRLGLASQYLEDSTCVERAVNAGINYFFSYDLSSDSLVDALKPLLQTQRSTLFIATGCESRSIDRLQQYFDDVRSLLSIKVINAFFLEYVSLQDDPSEVAAALKQLQCWKEKGLIRYVGASTHNRSIALQLIEQGAWDVLMLRYNMAHRSIEEAVLPAAQARGIPIIAFTCTRWGTLLQGHPQWQEAAPTAADCYRYALHHPAVGVALTAPATWSQLQENLRALTEPPLAIEEIERWQRYGELVYGSGQDAFETQWL